MDTDSKHPASVKSVAAQTGTSRANTGVRVQQGSLEAVVDGWGGGERDEYVQGE